MYTSNKLCSQSPEIFWTYNAPLFGRMFQITENFARSVLISSVSRYKFCYWYENGKDYRQKFPDFIFIGNTKKICRLIFPLYFGWLIETFKKPPTQSSSDWSQSFSITLINGGDSGFFLIVPRAFVSRIIINVLSFLDFKRDVKMYVWAETDIYDFY